MKLKLYFLSLMLLVGTMVSAQGYNPFFPDEYSDKRSSAALAASGSYAGFMPKTINDHFNALRDDFMGFTPIDYKYKSVQDIVQIGIKHDTLLKQSAYKYEIALTISCYDYKAPFPETPVRPITTTLTISYNPDSLKTFNDLAVFKFSGYHAIKVEVTGITDLTSGTAVAIPASGLSGIAKNFYIESKVIVQRYDLFNVQPLTKAELSNNQLKISWDLYKTTFSGCSTPSGSTKFNDYKPVSYELEWMYVDDYQYDAATNTLSYKYPSGSLNYNFNKNATRVQLNTRSYSIPLVYEHGLILYRVRTLRRDGTNYKGTVYGAWTLPATGSADLGASCAERYLYRISTPHSNDSLNWQYTINFAEDGKYKNVVNYFDGSLKDRQTQTKINTDSAYIVSVDKVYDYEGRPSIVSLPTPVLQSNLAYRPDLLLHNNTGKPYKAANFDSLTTCGRLDSIAPLAANALAYQYYSPANPDKTGMQQFVADAKGYPIVQTVYSPDNTNKIVWQGGAGQELQLWKGHGTQYEYIRANQYELNRLLGTESGKDAFYPKQIVTDPNGQSSFSIMDSRGKVVISGLQGSAPGNSTTPLDSLENYVRGEQVCLDVLKNMAQDRLADGWNASVSKYNDKDGATSIQYKVKTFPYYTGCSNQYLWAIAKYEFSVVNDCGVAVGSLSGQGAVGEQKTTTANGDASFASATLSNSSTPKGKYLINKKISFSAYDIRKQTETFIHANEPVCFYNVDYFIRNAVEAEQFPCQQPASDPKGDDCAKLKQQMMRELYPGAKYGQYQYTEPSRQFEGSAENSIFSLVVPPVPDTASLPAGTHITYLVGTTSQCEVACKTTVATCADGDGCGCGVGAHTYPARCCEECLVKHCKCIKFPHKQMGTKIPRSVSEPCAYIESSGWQWAGGSGAWRFTDSGLRTSVMLPRFQDVMYANSWDTSRSVWAIQHRCSAGKIHNFLEATRYVYNEYHGCVGTIVYKYPDPRAPGGTPYHVALNGEECIISQITEDRPAAGSHTYTYTVYDPGPDSISAEPAISLSYRYQSDCVSYPPVTYNGVTYSGEDIKKWSPDDFMKIFNDGIAEALLPLHPEYCKLMACDKSFEEQYAAIETFQKAETLGFFNLHDIVTKDPLFTKFKTPAYGMSASLAEDCLSSSTTQLYASGSASVAATENKFDYRAIKQVYCAAGNVGEMEYCAANQYSVQIAGKTFLNDALKQQYFELLRSYYLGNRTIAESFIDKRFHITPGSSCSCSSQMRLIGEPVFTSLYEPNRYDSGDSLVSGGDPIYVDFTPWMKDLYDKGLTQTPLDSIPAGFDSLWNESINADQVDLQVQGLMKGLSNCTVSETDKAALQSRILDSLQHGRTLTPGLVRNVILSIPGLSLNDLCHPFLVNYGLIPDTKSVESTPFACRDAEFYEGMKSFLNRIEVNTVLNNALAAPGYASGFSANITLSPFGSFNSELSAALAGTTSIKVRAALYNPPPASGAIDGRIVQLTVYSNTSVSSITFNILHSNFTGGPKINSLGSMSIASVNCINEEPGALKRGYQSEKTAILKVTCPTCITPETYYIWNGTLPLMTAVPDAASLAGSLTCPDIKQALDSFNVNQAAYSYSGAINHPLFEQTITNYLNYKLNKKYHYSDYRQLMEGCAVTDKTVLKQLTADYRLEFTNEVYLDTFVALINRNLWTRPVYTRYKTATSTILLFDFNVLPTDSILVYRNAILNTAIGLAISATANYMLPDENNMVIASSACTYDPASVSPSLFYNATPIAVSVWENDAYNPNYKLYQFRMGTSATAADQAQMLSAQLTYLHTPATSSEACNSTYSFFSKALLRSADYSTAFKQAYLTYVYGLSPSLDHNGIVAQVAPSALGTALPAYSGYSFTYDNPYCKGDRSMLYAYKPNPTLPSAGYQGYNLLKNTILSRITATSPNKLFPDADFSFVGTAKDLAIIRKANGNYWYRYFDNNNKLYNVFITPPAPNVVPPNVLGFSAVRMGAHPNTFYVDVNYLSPGGATITVTCTGYADFTLGASLVASGVILDQSKNGVTCVDTTDCENNMMYNAITNGKARYNQYFDSTATRISNDMLAYLVGTTKDTLMYCSQLQQYQYTLYYYDQAGNLTRTVPPAGVKTVFPYLQPNVDRYRDSRSTFLSESPAGTPYSLTYHEKTSVSQYNSLDLKTYQKTPDGGTVYYFYDAAGRMIFSQNSKQRIAGKYTYNLYDKLGRPMESGQVKLGCTYPASSTAEFDLTPCNFYLRNQSSGTTVLSAHPDFVQYAYDEVTYPYDTLVKYVRSKAREEVVITSYDEMTADLGTISTEMLSTQENLRNRAAAIQYYGNVPASSAPMPANAQFATYYSYDLTGNVKTITYDFYQLASLAQRYKRLDYDYDLVSGKVNMISYNRGRADQFYQQYDYDADNRITKVNTSNDGVIWNKDAAYTYYKHGPLATLKLGNQQIQSLEYAYTIQGWLKVINGDVLRSDKDMGVNSGTTDALYARDVVAHALQYYKDDYKTIGSTAVTTLPATENSLYNGNIVQQTTGIGGLGTMQRTYRYDQLQRLKLGTNVKVNDATASLDGSTPANLYKSSYTYDLDGNIKTLSRFDGSATPQQIDNFTYTYTAGNNRLQNVQDVGTASAFADLKGGQPTDNYAYDRTGNLVRDKQGAELMDWDHFGKIVSIRDTSSATQRFSSFQYDGKGNRIWKNISRPLVGGTEELEGEYYVRDGGGNLLSTYRTHSKLNRPLVFFELLKPETTGGSGVLLTALNELLSRSYPTGLKTVITANHSGWISTYTNRPVSFYLSKDPTLKSNLLFSGTSWIDALRSADAGVYKTAFLAAGTDVQPMFTAALDYSTEGSKLAELYSKHMSPFVCEPLWNTALTTYSPGDRATIYTALTGTSVTGSGTVLYDALATVSDPALATGLMSVMSSSHSSWLTTYTDKPISLYMSLDPYLKSNLLNCGTSWIDALRDAVPAVPREALLDAGMLVRPVFERALTAQTEGLQLLEYYSSAMPDFICQPIWSMVQAQYIPGNHAGNASNLYNSLTSMPWLQSPVSEQLVYGLQQQRQAGGDFYTAFMSDNNLWQSSLLRVQQDQVLTETVRVAVRDFGNDGLIGGFFDGWNDGPATLAACTAGDYKINTLLASDPVTVRADMSNTASRAELATILTGLSGISTVNFATRLINAGAAESTVRAVFTTAGSNPAVHTANATALISSLGSNPGLKTTIAGQMTSDLVSNHSMALPESDALINAMITDNTLWQSTSLRGTSGPWTTAIRTITYNYVPTNTLTSFFDNWSGAWAALDACTTPEYKLNAVYDSDPATTLSDMSAEASATEVAGVLSGMGDLTTAEFGKIIVDKGGNAEKVHDALLMSSSGDTIALAEHHIYGSSRLGVQRYDSMKVFSANSDTYVRSLGKRIPWYSYDFGDLVDSTQRDPFGTAGNTDTKEWKTGRTLGLRYYEITDHLQNVVATVMDRKTGHLPTTGATLYDYWNADIASSNDAYPGGMSMPGRTTEYAWSRFGAQGSPKDDEVYGKGNLIDMGDREMDTRILRPFKPDEHATTYPHLSPYNYANGNPIMFLDPDGKDNVIYLVALPSAKPILTPKNLTDIANQATQNFADLGLKTKVVVFDGGSSNFDINKIDKTDAVAVFGSKSTIVSYVSNTLKDKVFSADLDKNWGGGVANIEHSENVGGLPSDNIIPIDVTAIKEWTNTNLHSGIANRLEKGAGLIINHGAGHNGGLNHNSDETKGRRNYSPLMRDGAGLYKVLSDSRATYGDVVGNKKSEYGKPGRNNEFIDAVKKRFGDRTPTVKDVKKTK